MAYTTEQVLDILIDLDLLKSISQAPLFFDEPRFFNYSALIQFTNDVTNKKKISGSNGFSFYSKEEAVLKALCESIERYCLYAPQNLQTITLLKDGAYLFPVSKDFQATFKHWTLGTELITHKDVLIPTQLVYIDFKHFEEKEIQESNSTGAAFGFDKESTIMRGIYEIIERDAFLCFYLAKISPKKIRLSTVANKDFQNILKYINRFKLEVALFDITTDLGIPSFLTVLIDKTDIGPSIVLGLKSSLNSYQAILGSLKEALQLRPYIRYRKTKHSNTIINNRIKTIQDRANFWYSKDKMVFLDFILKQKASNFNQNGKYSYLDNLSTLLEILERNSFSVYSVNISQDIFPKDFLVYKILIPEMQQFYINESKKVINTKRLEKFLHPKFLTLINLTPHPFL